MLSQHANEIAGGHLGGIEGCGACLGQEDPGRDNEAKADKDRGYAYLLPKGKQGLARSETGKI
ncbi:hypothetical protein IZ6_17310 [Terrihabitans soli]|uniref:Uncharacterized protein n=1 Tax=Terrihabitans soli TaxID=708113 RepID=A0A6S6QNJ9_9HYPH|nr:hypothetical protein IZ6_17310 [Terrihabitans soli]